MVQEFGYTKEIEDRVLAPLPVSFVALAKVTSGAIQGLIAALLVFPIAAVVPANDVHLSFNWPVVLTLVPLACVASSALGLTFGTRFEPRTVPMMFGVIIIPITFLGCVYYSWTALGPIKVWGFSWLKWLVLVNPLVYMSEGFRGAFTTANHMSLAVVYLALAGFAALFLYLGINGFKKRVLS
jgi:ABC-2 type transport system permease protein